jgi:hypothetical protein
VVDVALYLAGIWVLALILEAWQGPRISPSLEPAPAPIPPSAP